MPDWRRRSILRALFCISLLISIVWATFQFTTHEEPPPPSELREQAGEAYWAKEFERASFLYEQATQEVGDDTAAYVVRLRELATIYGHREEYQQQLETMLRAENLAEKAGLDSLQSESAESLGYIYAFCEREDVTCEEDALFASTTVPGPIILVLAVLALIGLLYVVGVDRAKRG